MGTGLPEREHGQCTSRGESVWSDLKGTRTFTVMSSVGRCPSPRTRLMQRHYILRVKLRAQRAWTRATGTRAHAGNTTPSAGVPVGASQTRDTLPLSASSQLLETCCFCVRTRPAKGNH